MSVNQKKLAQSLGVSQYTVSVALGGNGRIGAATRKKVIKAAEEHGYRHNVLAAGLRGGKTRTIGMVWQFVDPWAGDAVIAYDLLERLQSQGYLAIQMQQHHSSEVLCHQIGNLIARGVDALVLRVNPSQLTHPSVVKLLKSAPPVIAVTWCDIPEFSGDILIHDREFSIRQVVEYFAETGRRQPVMALSMDHESNPYKYAVFADACEKCGIKTGCDTLLDINYPDIPAGSGERHRHCVRLNFSHKVDIDAFFCFNDVGAMFAMCEFQRLGVRVPEDVAVVGFNNTEVGRIASPQLATGDRKSVQVVEMLEVMLMDRINNPQVPPRRELVRMEFLWRESAGIRLSKRNGSNSSCNSFAYPQKKEEQ